MSENQSRFFVDERGGCIAVRDRLLTDPDYPGLHEDTTGVVWFRMGDPVTTRCPTCQNEKRGGWNVTDALRCEAFKVRGEKERAFKAEIEADILAGRDASPKAEESQ